MQKLEVKSCCGKVHDFSGGERRDGAQVEGGITGETMEAVSLSKCLCRSTVVKDVREIIWK